MAHKQLVRDVKREALVRMEDAARTEKDFEAVVEQWDKLDANRERRTSDWEKKRDEQTLEVGYHDGAVIPVPISHPAWREAIKGDFLSLIYDNPWEMWQLVEDWDIAILVKKLTDKQKEVLYLSAVRLCTAAQIACYHEQTDRAVRKLLAAAFDSIRPELAWKISQQISAAWPQMTLKKREFLKRYEKEKRGKKKAALDSGGRK